MSTIGTPCRRAIALALLLACVGGPGCAPRAEADEAQEARSPRTVHLVARHPDGVPLHRERGDHGDYERLPHGIEVEVLEEAEGGRWLRVRGGGRTGWITSRYVGPAGAAPPGGPPVAAAPAPMDPASPWASRASCEESLARGERASRAEGALRVGSWNVRWFPDGHDRRAEGSAGTDIAWLACLIAWLDLDALAVQEWKTDLGGRRATLDLLAHLQARTGHRWDVALDDCPDDGRQHVGLLWDTARVSAGGARSLPEVNPGRGGCFHRLRPGFTATLGRAGATEVQLVVVHLDSGTEARDRSNRRASARALARLGSLLPSGPPERGLLVLGDFNTMGCERCPERLDAPAEVADLEAALAAGAPPLARPAPAPECSEYYRGHAGLLDHAFVGGGIPVEAARVEVQGLCAVHRCADLHGAEPPALARLSDHCPLIVELGGE